MAKRLNLKLEPCVLDEGSVEEQLTFGRFVMSVGDTTLTRGYNIHEQTHEEGPLVSGFHIAEWLMWNLWRLVSEVAVTTFVDEASFQWYLAHSLSSIGAGYDWPNIDISTDGTAVWFQSENSPIDSSSSFEYSESSKSYVDVSEFENSVVQFANAMKQRLDDSGVKDTNLHCLIRDVEHERSSPELRRYRQIEAILGYEPDQLDSSLIGDFADCASELGEDAVLELAAHVTEQGAVPESLPTTQFIQKAATKVGIPVDIDWISKLNVSANEISSYLPWKHGVNLATQVRKVVGTPLDQLISNEILADIVGAPVSTFQNSSSRTLDYSFVLLTRDEHRLVLSSNFETSRRFDMARLLGDRLIGYNDRLLPATRSSTHRQKVQRAFAAEFLIPFEGMKTMLNGDYSEDKREKVARHFNVSVFAVNNQLKNYGEISDTSGESDTRLAS